MRCHRRERAHETADEESSETGDDEPRHEGGAPGARLGGGVLQFSADKSDADEEEEVAEDPREDLLAEHALPAFDAAESEHEAAERGRDAAEGAEGEARAEDGEPRRGGHGGCRGVVHGVGLERDEDEQGEGHGERRDAGGGEEVALEGGEAVRVGLHVDGLAQNDAAVDEEADEGADTGAVDADPLDAGGELVGGVHGFV